MVRTWTVTHGEKGGYWRVEMIFVVTDLLCLLVEKMSSGSKGASRNTIYKAVWKHPDP